ncbi:MAG: 3-hydroxyacyl-ACP dehydratase FabZ family protein [Vicinamibacteria bacterium]
MEILDVRKLLPHQPPILMLERVVDLEPGVSGVGRRLFRDGDACFAGHFPGRPLLPGVLMIEALAQTALVVLLAEHAAELQAAGPDLPLGYLARVQEMSFQRAIEPGQDVRFEVRVEKRLGQFTVIEGRVTSDGVLCAKGKLAVAMDQKQLEAALALRREGRTASTEGERQ